MHIDTQATEAAQQVCCGLWHLLEERQWDEAIKCLSENFEAYWPQSGEQLSGTKNFIVRNQAYPSERKI